MYNLLSYKPNNWGLNNIDELKKRYNIKVGFSDHSGGIFAPLLVAALGSEIIEFHVTFDKKMFGPDSKSSLDLNEVSMLVKGIKEYEIALKNPIDKNNLSNVDDLKLIFEKSLSVNDNLSKGSIINLQNLESKKPKGKGIDAYNFNRIIGRKINKDLKNVEFLNFF